ncbi:hypothetical protein N9Z38_00450 [Mariniblastus sp.]|nr:hypothetical protein [Mariniblastus sp.]
MEILQQLFPHIEQLSSRSRLLLLDFWTDESSDTKGTKSLVDPLKLALTTLGCEVDHQRIRCDEESIFELPDQLTGANADGIVLLPPMAFDQNSRETLSSLLTRQQLLRQQLVAPNNHSEPDNESWWAEMPWSLMKQRDLNAFVISLVISCLESDSTLNLLVPTSFLSGGRTSRLRDLLQSEAKLRLVLELGKGVPGLHHMLEVAWLAFELSDSEDSLVRCFKVPGTDDAESEVVVDDFKKLLRQQGGKTEYGYVLRNGFPSRGSWLVEAHHPRWTEYLTELGEIGNVTTLPELGDLSRGMGANPPTKEPNEFPIVHPRHLMADGSIDFETDEYARFLTNDHNAEQLKISRGDILIRGLHSFSDRQTPLRACFYPKQRTDHYLSSHLIRFRFNADIDQDVRQFVFAYLRSTEAAQWLASRAPGVHVQINQLRELPIPVPTDDVIRSFRRMRETKRQFDEWAAQLANIEDRLFKFDTLRDAQQEMIEVGSRAEQRVQAAKAADTLGWRVRNQYPHPLAFRFRSIEIMEDKQKKYSGLLDAAESAITFAAIVCCAMCEAFDGQPPDYIKTLGKKLRERPGTGISLGDWIAIVDNVNTGKKYRDIGSGIPFAEISKSYELNEGIKETILSLSNKRNDMAHQRRPDDHDMDRVIIETTAEVESLFESLDCLSRYRLRFITAVRPAGRRKVGTYSCHELIGDHPVPTVRTIHYEGDPPAVGLHLTDQNDQICFVEPWLVRRQCATCRHQETYVLDRYLKDKTISLKSFEYGHEFDGSDLREDFLEIGLELPE